MTEARATSEDLTPQRELIDYFYLFLERSWIIVICLIAAGIYSQYKLGRTPETYRATATIEVERDLQAAGNITEENRYRSQTDLVNVVSQKLQLDSLYYPVTALEPFQKMLPNPAVATPEEYESARQGLSQILNGITDVTMRPRSTLIDISATYTDPEIARETIAGMLFEFDKLGASTRAGESTANLEFLTKEIERIRQNLTRAEQSLVIYKEALRIREEIRESDAKIRDMEKEFLEKWPPLVEEKASLALLQDAYREELASITETSDTEYEFWSGHGEKMGEFDGDRLLDYQFRTAEARNNMLNRDFQTESSLYESLLAQVKRGDVESEFDQSEFAIVQPPYASSRPIGPIPMKFYLRYGILGLGAGAILAFLLGIIDATIRRIEEVERISGAPVMAAVPRGGKINKSIPIATDTPAAEAFRTMHAGIVLGEPESKTLLLTSSIPGEGKSTIACNLAGVAASQGERVLLLDLDLRRPRIHEYLGISADLPGVNDVLAGNASIEEATQKFGPEHGSAFNVMISGRRTGAANRLPNGADIGELIHTLAGSYDRVIIDTAPVLAVSDTLIIAKHVDTIALVFRMWKTPRKALARTCDQLDKNGTPPLGVVSNFMPNRKGFGQYGYYYSYSSSGYGAY